MDLRKVSFIMIALGVALVMYALNYDVTVSSGAGRIVNLHRSGQQNNMLIIGGFCFIAGVILFATFKIKQTPAEAQLEQAKNAQALANAKERTASLATKGMDASNNLSLILRQQKVIPLDVWWKLAIKFILGLFLQGKLVSAGFAAIDGKNDLVESYLENSGVINALALLAGVFITMNAKTVVRAMLRALGVFIILGVLVIFLIDEPDAQWTPYAVLSFVFDFLSK